MATNTELKKIVCSREVSAKLVALGITQAAVFHWTDVLKEDIEFFESTEEKWEPGLVFGVEERKALPAWTYEELRIMIGIHYPGADLPMPRPNPMPGEQQRFYIYLLHEAKNWESGAEANANYLLYLLESKLLAPADANNNYLTKFKPQ